MLKNVESALKEKMVIYQSFLLKISHAKNVMEQQQFQNQNSSAIQMIPIYVGFFITFLPLLRGGVNFKPCGTF